MPQLAIEGGFLAARPAAAPPGTRKPGGDFGAAMTAAERPQQAPRPERPEVSQDRDAGATAAPPSEPNAAPEPDSTEAASTEVASDGATSPDAPAEDQAGQPQVAADAVGQAQLNLQVQVVMFQLPPTQAAAPTAAAPNPALAAAAALGTAGTPAAALPQAVAQLAAQVAVATPAGPQPGQAAPSALTQAAQAVNVKAVQVGTTQATGPVAPVDPFLNWVEAQPDAEAAPVTMGSITPVQLSDEAMSLETAALVTAAASEEAEPTAEAAPAEATSGPTTLNAAPEKASGGEASRATAQPQAATQAARPDEVLPQILKQAELMKAQQQNTIKLQLYPEHLGKLEIKVMAHQGVLSAQLTADSAQVKGMLETQLVGLQRSLQEMGIKVDRVEVALSSSGLGGFDMGGSAFADPRGQGSGQQPSQGPRFSGGYDGWSGGAGDEAAAGAAAYAAGAGVSAINFVA
ncbi:MAG: flagellar hook-length control protein FliK [Candidatus Sericytochromatia bacterium]|nr:flagellar hook-length control protein FliK [Candidatus Sericytochromatia bacterium]